MMQPSEILGAVLHERFVSAGLSVEDCELSE